jgi:hypothetical protein
VFIAWVFKRIWSCYLKTHWCANRENDWSKEATVWERQWSKREDEQSGRRGRGIWSLYFNPIRWLLLIAVIHHTNTLLSLDISHIYIYGPYQVRKPFSLYESDRDYTHPLGLNEWLRLKIYSNDLMCIHHSSISF